MPAWFEDHCNLAKMFGKKCGKTRAMRKLGLSPQGRRHRGLDDARNIAMILVAMLRNGKTIEVNRGDT